MATIDHFVRDNEAFHLNYGDASQVIGVVLARRAQVRRRDGHRHISAAQLPHRWMRKAKTANRRIAYGDHRLREPARERLQHHAAGSGKRQRRLGNVHGLRIILLKGGRHPNMAQIIQHLGHGL